MRSAVAGFVVHNKGCACDYEREAEREVVDLVPEKTVALFLWVGPRGRLEGQDSCGEASVGFVPVFREVVDGFVRIRRNIPYVKRAIPRLCNVGWKANQDSACRSCVNTITQVVTTNVFSLQNHADNVRL